VKYDCRLQSFGVRFCQRGLRWLFGHIMETCLNSPMQHTEQVRRHIQYIQYVDVLLYTTVHILWNAIKIAVLRPLQQDSVQEPWYIGSPGDPSPLSPYGHPKVALWVLAENPGESPRPRPSLHPAQSGQSLPRHQQMSSLPSYCHAILHI
jgi:hypothetical protein